MTSEEILTRMRTRHYNDLRTFFPGLSERDIMQLLYAPPQHAVGILQHCFACDMEDAKAAWNDFVLRYIDGPAVAESQFDRQTIERPAHLC